MTVTDVLLSGLVIILFGCGVGYLAYIVKGRMEKRKILNKDYILKRLDEKIFIDHPEPEFKEKEDKPKKEKKAIVKAKNNKKGKKGPGKRKDLKANKTSKKGK